MFSKEHVHYGCYVDDDGLSTDLDAHVKEDGSVLLLIPVPRAKNYVCSKCNFKSKEHRHLKNHLDKGDCFSGRFALGFKCGTCRLTFTTIKLANAHLSVHKGDSDGKLEKLILEQVKALNLGKGTLAAVKGERFLDDYAMDFGLNMVSYKAMKEGRPSYKVTSLLSSVLGASRDYSEGGVVGTGVIRMVPWWQETLFLPINHNQNHWSLVVMDRKSKRFVHYDSLFSVGHQVHAKAVVRQLGELCKGVLGICDFLQYQFVRGVCSQQSDGINCGVHAILNAKSRIGQSVGGTISSAECKQFRESFGGAYIELCAIVRSEEVLTKESPSVDINAIGVTTARRTSQRKNDHKCKATSESEKEWMAGGDCLQSCPGQQSGTGVPHKARLDVSSAKIKRRSSITIPKEGTEKGSLISGRACGGMCPCIEPDDCAKWRGFSTRNGIAAACTEEAPDPPQDIHEIRTMREELADRKEKRQARSRTSGKDGKQGSLQLFSSGDKLDNLNSKGEGKCDMTKKMQEFGLGKVIKRIPKAARHFAATIFSKVLQDVVEKNDWESWCRLFRFPSACLILPGRRIKGSNLTTYVKERLTSFASGTHIAEPTSGMKKDKTKSNSSYFLSRGISSKLSEGDIKGAVRLLSGEDTLAPYDHTTLDALRSKHPSSPADLSSPPVPSTTELKVSTAEVKKSITTFPCGSSGGCDGLRPQHLKDMTSFSLGEAGSTLIKSITSFVQFVICGGVPEIIRPAFFGARLIALKKKCGGIRPIAVGMTLRRLAAKVCNGRVLAAASKEFMPAQLGFGIPHGSEAAVHAVRKYVKVHGKPGSGGKVLLKIDFKNAFNSVRRDHFLKAVREKYEQLYPFVYAGYADHSDLLWGDTIISSAEGVQQGDPMGPFLFCLSIQDLVNSMTSEVNVWYLDDGTLAGDCETVWQDFQKILAMGASLGLSINASKCELCILSQDDDFIASSIARFKGQAAHMKIVLCDDLSLLGGAIGDKQITTFLTQKLTTMKTLCGRLNGIDRHEALFLLKHSISVPKLVYLLRTSNCSGDPLIEKFDGILAECLESILNCRMSDRQWKRSTLPVSVGGLGIRSASDLALPAFLASNYAVKELADTINKIGSDTEDESFSRARETWQKKFEVEPLDKLGNQRAWDRIGCAARIRLLMDTSSTTREKASLVASQDPYSGAWLNALPVAQLGLKLNNEDLRIAAALRIGAQVCQPHTCACGVKVDSSGTHGLSCVRAPGRRARHTHVNDLIKRALSSANVPSILEPVGLYRSDGKRPDGMSLVPWEKGRCLLWDFTCGDTLAKSHLPQSSISAGQVALAAEKRKETKYKKLMDNFIFIPVAVETSGAWGMQAKAFIKKLGKRLAEVTGEKRSHEFLVQTISTYIQRGNAQSIASTLPADMDLTSVMSIL